MILPCGISFPDRIADPGLAEALASKGGSARAIGLIEEVIRRDPLRGLNELHALRADLLAEIGFVDPARAVLAYQEGVFAQSEGRYEDGVRAYLEAARLDEQFLWPTNNLAWMLSTCQQRAMRNGPIAILYARHVCECSGWSCWAFLGTLAAAHAEAGSLDEAIRWQRKAISLAPDGRRPEQAAILSRFTSGVPLVDFGMAPAAGAAPGRWQ